MSLPTNRIKKITASDGTSYDIVPEMLQKSGYSAELPALTANSTIALTSDLPTNKAATSGGTDDSLVTTGDKYNWNNKQTVFKSVADVGLTAPTTIKAFIQALITGSKTYSYSIIMNENNGTFTDAPSSYGTLIVEMGGQVLRPRVEYIVQVGNVYGYKRFEGNIIRSSGSTVSEINWHDLEISNPNLFYNSNFAINQLNGYYATAGVDVYQDSAVTNKIGTLNSIMQTVYVSGSVRSVSNPSVVGASGCTYREEIASNPRLILTYTADGVVGVVNLYGINGTTETLIAPTQYTWDSRYNAVTINNVSVLDAYTKFAVYYQLSSTAQTISGTLYIKTSDSTFGYYTGAGKQITVDGIYSNRSIVQPQTDGGIKLYEAPGMVNPYIQQIYEYAGALNGKKLTLSINIGGTIYMHKITTAVPSTSSTSVFYNKDITFGSYSCNLQLTRTANLFVTFTIASPNGVKINWWKLEVGETLTPYAPPMYAEEIQKCMRYMVNLGANGTFRTSGFLTSSGKAYYMNIPLPTIMAKTPSVNTMHYIPTWKCRTTTGYSGATSSNFVPFVTYTINGSLGSVTLVNTLSSAAGDTNNTVMAFEINGLVLTANL